MLRNAKTNNQKKLFKRAVAAYIPGMSVRQLMSALQVRHFTARRLFYTIRNLESIEGR